MKDSWDDLDVMTKADLIAYSQIREYEEAKKDEALVQVLGVR